MVATISIMWLVSGLVGFAKQGVAETVLTGRGIDPALATLIVLGGSVIDCAIGLALLWRPWARRAALASVAVALGYLAGASVFAPDLWADPLGPLVKVLPAITLGLVAAALLEDR